jgi:putative ABC transport system permease protein
MTGVRKLRTIVRSLIGQRRQEREMSDELEFHVASRAQDLINAGMGREAAEARARQELGDVRVWREDARQARGLRILDDVRADVRYGVRWLRRSPTFSVSAVLSIGVGVAAATVMFSLANALLLKLLPVADPLSLVLFSRSNARDNLGASFPYPFCRDLQNQHTTLSSVTCRAGMGPPVVEIDGPAELVSGELVSGTFFDMLGVTPHLGRLFSPSDNVTPGGHPLVVLSYGYWQRRFGGDPATIGRTIRVNSTTMTIVGVTPPGFVGVEMGFSPDIRLPIVMGTPHARLNSPEEWWLQIIGRLKPGVDRDTATAELDTRYQAFYSMLPAEYRRDHKLTLLPAGQGIRRLQDRFETPLVVLNVLAATILVIVCLNVANLMIARAVARAREFSLRRALGARTSRIVIQLVVESSLIAAAGGMLSLIIAAWLIPIVAVAAVPANTVALIGVGMDIRIVAFAAALCGIVAIVSGLAPALALRKAGLDSAIRDRQSIGAGAKGRRVLVALQVALSFAMLVAAGLFTRTLTGLQTLDLGFNAENLVLVGLGPPDGSEPAERVRFFADVEARVAGIPGIQASSFAMMPLLGRGEWGSGLTLDTGERDPQPEPRRNAVGPEFFRAVGMPLVAGREFSSSDTVSSPKVAIVNESFAQRFFGGQAIGRRIGTGGTKGVADWTIVGVTRDAKGAFLREASVPVWYVPYRQMPSVYNLVLHVRTQGPPESAHPAIRAAIADVDPRVPIRSIISMDEQIGQQLVTERLLAGLSLSFATFAVGLAALGLYGVTAYTTLARTREIGVRMALGATSSRIVVLILGQVATLIALGLAGGLGIVLVSAGRLQPLLFGIQPLDAVTIAAASVLVSAATLAAAWFPIRYVVRLSPTIALR